MFIWSGNFQGHVCAGRFTRPCIVHTEFWRLVNKKTYRNEKKYLKCVNFQIIFKLSTRKTWVNPQTKHKSSLKQNIMSQLPNKEYVNFQNILSFIRYLRRQSMSIEHDHMIEILSFHRCSSVRIIVALTRKYKTSSLIGEDALVAAYTTGGKQSTKRRV